MAYIHMSLAAGSRGFAMTPHIADLLERFGIACVPVVVTSCDSSRNIQAKPITVKHSTAAPSPGALRPPICTRMDPIAGPTTAPRLVAAESQPSVLARSFESLMSAQYA